MSEALQLDSTSVSGSLDPASTHVPRSVKLFYGLGDLSSGLVAAGSGLILFYYSQVLGLSAGWVGTAMFVSLCADAVIDMLAGGLSDSAKTRWGRRHPFLFLSAIPFAAAFYLTFTVPSGLPTWALMTWMVCTTTCWRFAASFFVIPYWALGTELSQDFHERTTIGAYRIIGQYLGMSLGFGLNMVVFGGGPDKTKGQFEIGNYHIIAIIVAIMVIVAIWGCAFGTRSVIPGLPKAVKKFSFLGMLKEMWGFLGNRPFCIFFSGAFMFCLVHAIYNVASIYMGTYFWGLSTSQIFLMPTIGIAGVVAGTTIWAAISRRLGKKRSYMLGAAGFCVLTAIPILLKIGGIFIAHDNPAYFPVIAFLGFLAFASGASGSVIAASMLPDVIEDYAAGRPEKSVAGLITGMLNLNLKVGLAVTNLIIGAMLAFVGLGKKIDIASVDPSVIDRLGISYIGLMALFTVICLAIFSFYPIPDRKWQPKAR